MIVAEGSIAKAWGDRGGRLQWGRNLIVAEGIRIGGFVARPRRLQWGRNLIVAEGPNLVNSGIALSGFNGAAT